MPGGGSQTASNKPEFAEEVKPFITPLFEKAQGEFDKTFGQKFEGDFIAPTAPQAGEGLSLIEQVARGAGGAGSASRSIADQFATDIASNRFLDSRERFEATAGGDVLDQAIGGATANIKEQLLEDVLPAIRSQAIEQGAFGGGKFAESQVSALDDFSENALNIANQLAFQDLSEVRNLNAAAVAQRNALLPQLFGAETGAATTASNLLDRGLQQDLFAGNVLRDVGAGEQQIDQNTINNLLAQFQQEQTGGFGQLQQLAGILGGFNPIGSTTTTSGGGGGIKGAITGGLGGAGLGAALASAGVTGGATIPLSLFGALAGGM